VVNFQILPNTRLVQTVYVLRCLVASTTTLLQQLYRIVEPKNVSGCFGVLFQF